MGFYFSIKSVCYHLRNQAATQFPLPYTRRQVYNHSQRWCSAVPVPFLILGRLISANRNGHREGDADKRVVSFCSTLFFAYKFPEHVHQLVQQHVSLNRFWHAAIFVVWFARDPVMIVLAHCRLCHLRDDVTCWDGFFSRTISTHEIQGSNKESFNSHLLTT